MKEIGARRLASATFKGLVDLGEPVAFYTGHTGRERRVIALPADQWTDNVLGVYAGVDPVRLTHHTEIDDGLIVRLLTEQVDEDWRPKAYAALVQGDAVVWWIVPANGYWLGRVGEASDD